MVLPVAASVAWYVGVGRSLLIGKFATTGRMHSLYAENESSCNAVLGETAQARNHQVQPTAAKKKSKDPRFSVGAEVRVVATSDV